MTSERPTLRAFRWCISHLGALATLGVATLYLLGIVVSAGQIRASGLEVAPTLSRIPLEQHARNGVAVLTSPVFPVAIVASMVLYSMARGEAAVGRAVAAGRRPPADWWDRNVRPVMLSFFFTLIVIAPSWPVALGVVVGMSAVLVPLTLAVLLGGFWQRHIAETYVAAAVLAACAVAGIDAYFRGDPLPTATVTVEHEALTGPLIGVGDGLVYLGQPDPDGLYVATAIDGVTRLTVTRNKRDREPSLPELLGIP